MAAFDVEISRATEWLTSTLLPTVSPHRESFESSVKAELELRYTGHWYPEEAHRGCGYRSLTCNGTLDPLLERALAKAAIARDQLQQPVRNFMLWVNPGEVKWANESGVKSHIYCAGSTPNPYSKPKVNVARTVMNVRASEDDRATGAASSNSSSNSSSGSASPAASRVESPTASPKLSASAANFVPKATFHTSSQSSSDAGSDSEHDMPSHPQPAFAKAPMPPPGLAPLANRKPTPADGHWQRAPQRVAVGVH